MAASPSSSDADSLYDRRSDDLRTLSLRTSSRRDAHPIQYSFAQAFGERGADAPSPAVVDDADIISAVRFSPNTDMIAAGDKGGRIVILKRVHRKHGATASGSTPRRGRSSPNRSPSPSPTRHAFPTFPGLDEEEDSGSGGDRSYVGDGGRGGSGGDRQGATRRNGVTNEAGDGNAGVDDDGGNADTRQHVVDAPEFRFWTQFQSHEPEFDYLKSMEIEEKINQIRWCRSAAGSHRLVATNDKKIKVWRVQERELKTVSCLNPRALLPREEDARPPPPICLPPSYQQQQLQQQQPRPPQQQSRGHPPRRQAVTPNISTQRNYSSVLFPRLEPLGRVITATPRRVLSNAHSYHINSISLSSDEETFLSADDLRIHLWHLYAGGAGFNVLDIKPDSMEDLTEVITSAEFHPSHCHLFMYSSSRGILKLCDLRQSALCHAPARKYEERDHTSTRTSFFSEIIASISDAKFSPNGQQILTRDYMSLRLWDMRIERAPLRVISVHEHLRSRLCDLYENDCIFDKFQCNFSSDGRSLLTGSYNALFHAYSAHSGYGSAVEVSVDCVSGLSARQRYAPMGGNRLNGVGGTDLVDPRRRIMQLDSSADEQIAAVAAGPALYLYYGARRYGTM